MINRILEFYLLTLTYSVVVITSDFLVSSVSSTSMYVILNLLKPSTRPWVIKICQDSLPPYGRWVLWKDNKNHEKCLNTIEILCQGNVSMYGVLDITSDTKVPRHESKTSDLTRLFYHAWFPKPHTHISTLKYQHCWKVQTSGKKLQIIVLCSHMWQ